MGLADEFTAPMARCRHRRRRTPIRRSWPCSREQNAFVTRLPDGESYRFHHMMKDCAEQAFARAAAGRRAVAYHGRYGAWYDAHGAVSARARAPTGRAEDYDAVLQVDRGRTRASCWQRSARRRCWTCLDALPAWMRFSAHPLAHAGADAPDVHLAADPQNAGAASALLEAADCGQHPELPDARSGDNLLGECDLILSFLHVQRYHPAMSRLHRSASRAA